MARSDGESHNLMAVVGFTVSTLLASLILLVALVMWLGELLGSTLLSMLIVGGSFTLISIILYAARIRPLIQEIRDQLRTIFEVATLAQQGYELTRGWLVRLIQKI